MFLVPSASIFSYSFLTMVAPTAVSSTSKKAQLFKGSSHRTDSDALVICHKGRRDTYNDRFSPLHKHLDLLGLVDNLLGVLGTYHKALAAKNTFVADYVGLISRKTNGLDRTVTNTFISVFAVGFF